MDTPLSVIINDSVFDRNQGKTVISGEADNGNLSLKMAKDRMVVNEGSGDYSVALMLNSYPGGSISAELENNIIAGNIAQWEASGIILQSSGNASSILFHSTNDTITDNICTNTGAAVQVIAENFGDIQISMTNSILKGNQAGYSPTDLSLQEGMFDDYSGTVSFSADYCIIGDYTLRHGTPTYNSTHEIDGDPALNSTYHLTSGSVAKNAGLCGYLTGSGPYQYHRIAPYDDIDGDKRPGWGKLTGCDIGADEYRFPWVLFGPATRGTGHP